MFKVVTTKGFYQEFERWTDALSHAKSLMPTCKSLLEDIRILEREHVVWVYSRSHKFPMYVGPHAYDRLARLFLLEAMAEAETTAAATPPTQETSL